MKILETSYYAFMIMAGYICGAFIVPIIINEVMMVVG